MKLLYVSYNFINILTLILCLVILILCFSSYKKNNITEKDYKIRIVIEAILCIAHIVKAFICYSFNSWIVADILCTILWLINVCMSYYYMQRRYGKNNYVSK